jgi:hypothetical protein
VAIERGWPAGRIRPRYIVLEPGKTILQAVRSDSTLGGRIYGVRPLLPIWDAAIQNGFFDRWHGFTGLDLSREIVRPWWYDAAYLLGASAVAMESSTVSSIMKSLESMNPPGRRFEVGPRDFPGLLTALRGGIDVDLEGASGALVNPPNMQVWCLTAGPPPAFESAGLTYDGVSGKASGHLLACH